MAVAEFGCERYLESLIDSYLDPIPTGEGGGGAHCEPQVYFLKYLKKALSYGLETF